MNGCVITCGVYGFDAQAFAKAVVAAKPDKFVDVRRRRGVRGHDYAFANSRRLQDLLENHGIPYMHRLDLAAPEDVMKREGEIDKAHHIARHERDSLSPEFIADYEREVLAGFDAAAFIATLGDGVQRPLLFCVERTASACHRGLIADAIVAQLGWDREDVVPR